MARTVLEQIASVDNFSLSSPWQELDYSYYELLWDGIALGEQGLRLNDTSCVYLFTVTLPASYFTDEDVLKTPEKLLVLNNVLTPILAQNGCVESEELLVLRWAAEEPGNGGDLLISLGGSVPVVVPFEAHQALTIGLVQIGSTTQLQVSQNGLVYFVQDVSLPQTSELSNGLIQGFLLFEQNDGLVGWYPPNLAQLYTPSQDSFVDELTVNAYVLQEKTYYDLTLLVNNNQGGTIKADRTNSIPEGTAVKISASAESGWLFNRFNIVSSTQSTTTSNPYTLTINSDTKVTAFFDQQSEEPVESGYKIVPVVLGNGGKIQLSASGLSSTNTALSVDPGEKVTISVSPESNYGIYSINIDGSTQIFDIPESETVTHELIANKDLSISALFVNKNITEKEFLITPTHVKTALLSGHAVDMPYITNYKTVNATHFVENEYITINNAKYLKVFDHDVSADPINNALYFSNENEAKYCFKPNKFSRLGDLGSNLFKSNTGHKYEFLLRYSGGPTNIWKQSANPYEPTFENSGNVTGYEDVAIQMTGRWGSDGEAPTGKGLGLYTAPTAEPDCLLDTQPGHDYWWGGLGQYKPYTENGITGFPSADGTIEQHVQLWVRVDNTPYDAYTAIQKTNDNEYVVYSDNFIEN